MSDMERRKQRGKVLADSQDAQLLPRIQEFVLDMGQMKEDSRNKLCHIYIDRKTMPWQLEDDCPLRCRLHDFFRRELVTDAEFHTSKILLLLHFTLVCNHIELCDKLHIHLNLIATSRPLAC